MNRYDWSNIPLNIFYIATDSSGWVNGFEREPVLDKSFGLWKGDGVHSLKSPQVNKTRWWDKESGEYWKDSLEVRVDE